MSTHRPLSPAACIAAPLAVLCAGLAPLRAQGPAYRVTDLGPVPGGSQFAGVTCAAISPDGSVLAGTSVWDPYTWRPASGMLALQIPTGFPNGAAYDVNDAGVAVGSVGLPTVSYPTTPALWDAQGNVTLLGRLGGPTDFGSAVAVNNLGVVVGGSELPSGISHAFRWTQATGMVDLTPGSGPSGALDINDAGQIAMYVGNDGFRLTPGIGLEPLGPVIPSCINQSGQMAGKDVATGTAGRWTDGIGWEMFGQGAPVDLRELTGINGHGEIVGAQWIRQHSSPPSYQKIGYLWTPGLGFQRLENLVQSTQPVRITGVAGITDTGRIAAYGSIGSNNRAMLLEPLFVSDLGGGCAPAGARVPRLGSSGVPARGGRIALLGSGGHGSGVGLFALALAPGNVPLPGGCAASIDLGAAALSFVPLNAIGQGSFSFAIPAGVQRAALHVQWASLDPAVGLGSLALSNALRVDVQ